MTEKPLVFDLTGPVGTIYVETDELGQSIFMRWVTVTLPGHDENGARGPYTHRMRSDLNKANGATGVFAAVANMMRDAATQGVCPQVDQSVMLLLKEWSDASE